MIHKPPPTGCLDIFLLITVYFGLYNLELLKYILKITALYIPQPGFVKVGCSSSFPMFVDTILVPPFLYLARSTYQHQNLHRG